MNDNVTETPPATVIPPREEVQQTDVHQYVQALIDVYWATLELGPNNGNCLTDELNSAIDNPILDTMPPEQVLATIDACVNMAMPGSPLYARGVGIVSLTFPGGKISPAIALELYPGKQVLMAMSRETAEGFEKILKAAIDEHFGRIIKP